MKCICCHFHVTVILNIPIGLSKNHLVAFGLQFNSWDKVNDWIFSYENILVKLESNKKLFHRKHIQVISRDEKLIFKTWNYEITISFYTWGIRYKIECLKKILFCIT